MLDDIFENRDFYRPSTIKKHPLELKYAWIVLAIAIVFQIILVLASVVLTNLSIIPELPLLLYSGIFVFVVYNIYLFYAVRARYFAIDEHNVWYFKGLLKKTVTTQPFSRIQHLEIVKGLIDRQNNLAKIVVYSAGNSKYSLLIPGLSLKQAQSIRNQILESCHHVNSS